VTSIIVRILCEFLIKELVFASCLYHSFFTVRLRPSAFRSEVWFLFSERSFLPRVVCCSSSLECAACSRIRFLWPVHPRRLFFFSKFDFRCRRSPLVGVGDFLLPCSSVWSVPTWGSCGCVSATIFCLQPLVLRFDSCSRAEGFEVFPLDRGLPRRSVFFRSATQVRQASRTTGSSLSLRSHPFVRPFAKSHGLLLISVLICSFSPPMRAVGIC
jgi:hypothetical protein